MRISPDYPAPVLPGVTSGSLAAMWDSLARKSFFKLIGGGSFTESERLTRLSRIYTLAGADCLDIAPDQDVLYAVERVLTDLPMLLRPVVMVSLPLDPDPHFRKIELTEPDCIRCGVCLPVCPTDAINLPEALEISQSLCYGCGRCVPVCPTDALSLLPFQVEDQIAAVLENPLVQAVEIHSRYVDPYMLEIFLGRWQPLLKGKLISLCFRPDEVNPEARSAQIVQFCQTAQAYSDLPVILQIDGAPMSGNDRPEASIPALEAAVQVYEIFRERGISLPPLTVSGGINQETARLLENPRYAFIAGVGMGTVARRHVWELEEEQAVPKAKNMVQSFKKRSNPLAEGDLV